MRSQNIIKIPQKSDVTLCLLAKSSPALPAAGLQSAQQVALVRVSLASVRPPGQRVCE